MELTIKYTGRNISFVTDDGKPQDLRVSEHKIRAIREAGGPRLNVIADKVRAILEGHVWQTATTVWVEQRGERLIVGPVAA